ncbi:hypothetical protein BamMEX5DRAFT_1356 [Burkholderia ambifaria MEX-5]|uniref:Uncharacterized protein n=1 Tax=Burkholderia ambifaria MEX-5 TaxID=396597 RepID=B1T0P0_9BURK|nr:hypothetical protein BamMEX5DRAFT_1356 [Burkholderia ambifaria MEX-5]
MPDALLPVLVSDSECFADALADELHAKPEAVRTGKVLEVIGTLVKAGGWMYRWASCANYVRRTGRCFSMRR